MMMHNETSVICGSPENHENQLFILTSQRLADEVTVPLMKISVLHCALNAFGSAPL